MSKPCIIKDHIFLDYLEPEIVPDSAEGAPPVNENNIDVTIETDQEPKKEDYSMYPADWVKKMKNLRKMCPKKGVNPNFCQKWLTVKW